MWAEYVWGPVSKHGSAREDAMGDSRRGGCLTDWVWAAVGSQDLYVEKFDDPVFMS